MGLQAKNKSIMKSTLLNELMKIPKDATFITVQGVEMQVIDKEEPDAISEIPLLYWGIHTTLYRETRILFSV